MTQYVLTVPQTLDSDAGERAARGSADDDVLLMDRFLAGENSALVGLFDRHNRRLFIYCLKLVGNRDQAKDLMQELWERVLRLRLKPRRVENPAGFLVRMARNLCLNHIEGRRHHLSLGVLPESAHPASSDDGSEAELEEAILASLAELPFEYREVLVLNVYCGYRFEEIATLLDKSPEAIWKRASRARKQLRSLVTGRTRS